MLGSNTSKSHSTLFNLLECFIPERSATGLSITYCRPLRSVHAPYEMNPDNSAFDGLVYTLYVLRFWIFGFPKIPSASHKGMSQRGGCDAISLLFLTQS